MSCHDYPVSILFHFEKSELRVFEKMNHEATYSFGTVIDTFISHRFDVSQIYCTMKVAIKSILKTTNCNLQLLQVKKINVKI